MAEIVWTEAALQNLDDVVEFIALSNPMAAQNLVKNVLSKIERLSTHPESGRVPSEIAEFNYREVVVNPLRIFYSYREDKVFILFVMRQEQDLRRFLLSQ